MNPSHNRKSLAAITLGAVMIALALPLGVFLKSGQIYDVMIAFSALMLLSAPMARAKTLLPQLLARALWWQALTFGTLLGTNLLYDALRLPYGLAGSNRYLIITSLLSVTGSGLALLGARSVGLHHSSKHFDPHTHRPSLMIALIMAMADALALTFYTGLVLTEHYANAFPIGASALVMIGAIWGLYRLKVWGLLFNAGANLAIAALAIGGAFDLPNFITYGLAITAFAQLALLAPLLRDVARNLRQHKEESAPQTTETQVILGDTSAQVILETATQEVSSRA